MKNVHGTYLELAAASIDFELLPEERESLRRHVSSCSACRDRIEALYRDARGIVELPIIALPEPAAAAVWEALARRHRPHTSTTLRLVLVAALLALLAVAALSAGAELLRPSDDLAIVPTLTSSPPPGSPQPDPTPILSSAPEGSSELPDPTWGPVAGDPALPTLPGASGERFARALAVVVAGGQAIIAVGCLEEPQEVGSPACTAPAAWRSLDGTRWDGPTPLPTDQADASFATAAAVTVFRDLIVAVGSTTKDGVLTATFWTSSAGSEWTRAQPGEAAGVTPRALAVHNGRLVVVGGGQDGGPAAWHSESGTDWTVGTFEGGRQIAPLAGVVRTGTEGLLAWGWAGDALAPDYEWWRSADGVNWLATGAPTGLEDAGVARMYATDAGLIAHGTILENDEIRAAVWTRVTDEAAWTESESWRGSGLAPIDVLAINTGAVAVAYDEAQQAAVIWLQPPGGTWRRSTTIAGATPVALVGDPGAIDRVYLLARNGVGETVVWTGTLPW